MSLVLSSTILNTRVGRVMNNDIPLCSVPDLSRKLSDGEASLSLGVAQPTLSLVCLVYRRLVLYLALIFLEAHLISSQYVSVSCRF